MATDETATITENEEKSSRSQEKYKKEVTEYAEQPTESENKKRTDYAHAGTNSNAESAAGSTFEKVSNGSGISQELGEAKSKLSQSRANEHQHRDNGVKSSLSQENDKKEATEYAEQPAESENKERPRRFTSEEIENGRKHMPKSTIITKNALTVPKMDNESKESHDLP